MTDSVYVYQQRVDENQFLNAKVEDSKIFFKESNVS